VPYSVWGKKRTLPPPPPPREPSTFKRQRTTPLLWPQRVDTAWYAEVAASVVEVRDTGKDRGLGVFALRDIPPETTLGWYRGEALDGEALEARYPDPAAPPRYVLQVADDVYVDGVNPEYRNWTALINDARGTGLPVNVQFGAHGGRRGLLRTVLPVAAGDELLWTYSKSYWAGTPIANLPLLRKPLPKARPFTERKGKE
jgi:hypothetical protein